MLTHLIHDGAWARQGKAIRVVWVPVSTNYPLGRVQIWKSRAAPTSYVYYPRGRAHARRTGVVCENMQGLGAKLRKLAGQAKICTPLGGEVIAKICTAASRVRVRPVGRPSFSSFAAT